MIQMSSQCTCVIKRSPSLNTLAPKTSTIFILSDSLCKKDTKRYNKVTKYPHILRLFCSYSVSAPNANLKRPQKRDTLNEGLIHLPLFRIISNNQPVKCGSVLQGKKKRI